MEYTIVGAGAIGGTVGAYLSRAGHQVLFVDTALDHVEAINAHGIDLTTYDESFTTGAHAVTPDKLPSDLHRVILAVKSPATQAAIRMIAPNLAPDGFVMSAQNGLNEHWIAEVIGRRRTIGCFINFSATYREPGKILLGGPGAFYIGELDGHITPRLMALQHDLSAWSVAGQDRRQVRMTDNIWGYLWGKMGYGAMLFGTALTNETMADGIANHYPVLVALAHEVMRVAQAEGVQPLGFDGYDPDAVMSGRKERIEPFIANLVEMRRRDTQTHSGVWRDLAIRKRKTEVDAQFLPILDRAARHRVETPALHKLVRMIHEIEDGTRALATANLVELSASLTNPAKIPQNSAQD